MKWILLSLVIMTEVSWAAYPVLRASGGLREYEASIVYLGDEVIWKDFDFYRALVPFTATGDLAADRTAGLLEKMVDPNDYLVGLTANVQFQLDGLDARITTNRTDIDANDVELADHETRITTNRTDIDANDVELADHETRITTNRTDIDSNDVELADHETRITTNRTDIDSNDVELADHETRITTNRTDIDSNDVELADHETRITTNRTDIDSNDADILEIQNNLPLPMAKGSILVSDGTNNQAFAPCADDQIVVWDVNETFGLKCEDKPVMSGGGLPTQEFIPLNNVADQDMGGASTLATADGATFEYVAKFEINKAEYANTPINDNIRASGRFGNPNSQNITFRGHMNEDGSFYVLGVYGTTPLFSAFNADGTFNATLTNAVTSTIGSRTSLQGFDVQPDGKMIFSFYSNGSDRLIRINTDGTKDTAFSSALAAQGCNTDTSNITYCYASDIDVLPTGEIFLFGRFNQSFGLGAQQTAVIKLNSDGTPDTAFNNEVGLGTTKFSGGNGYQVYAYDGTVRPDGKIIVVGDIRYSGGANWIACFEPDGTISTCHANLAGYAQVGQYDVVHSVAAAPDNSFVIYGQVQNWKGNAAADYLVFMNPDGTVNTAAQSVENTATMSSADYKWVVYDATTSEYIVTGNFTNALGTGADYIVRVGKDGGINQSFATWKVANGYGVSQYEYYRNPYASVNSTGKTLIAGNFSNFTQTGLHVAAVLDPTPQEVPYQTYYERGTIRALNIDTTINFNNTNQVYAGAGDPNISFSFDDTTKNMKVTVPDLVNGNIQGESYIRYTKSLIEDPNP